MPKALPTSDIESYRQLVAPCITWEDARHTLAAHIGCHPDTVTRLRRRLAKQGVVLWSEPKAAVGSASAPKSPPTITSSTPDGFNVDVELSKASTIEEVIELCKVDSSIWESKGFNVRRARHGFAWSARFARKAAQLDPVALAAAFAARVASHAPRKWTAPTQLSKGADCLYILNTQDLHLAKLAHHAETGGADWDIKIAEAAFRQAVKELLAKAPASRIEEVVVIVGSDMLQIDTDRSTTTAGTYVDSDSRLSKVFDTAAKMLTDVIEDIASRFKVRVVVIPGNHDNVTSHMLGRYVEAWFHTNPNVIVDGSPASRKYVGYGATLIAFDHGDGTKLKNLPLVVMRENQRTISQYRFIEVLTGHRHIEASEDIKGVVVRTAPALCSADSWHSDSGYIGSNRRSQGLLYRRDSGLEAIFYSRALD